MGVLWWRCTVSLGGAAWALVIDLVTSFAASVHCVLTHPSLPLAVYWCIPCDCEQEAPTRGTSTRGCSLHKGRWLGLF